MSAFAIGGRVQHAHREGRLGTVVAEGPEPGTSRVDWDAIYGETIELDVNLLADAPMPAPEYALAKALRYRRQRDRALEELAALVGIESNAAIERERYERQLEDAHFEYEAQLANIAKVLQKTRDELFAADLALDLAETKLRNVERFVDKAGAYSDAGDYVSADAALEGIARVFGRELDTPPVDSPPA